MAELKPCPFCGYGADLRYRILHDTQTLKNNTSYVVKCRKCRAKMEGDTQAPLIKAWNRRADNGN